MDFNDITKKITEKAKKLGKDTAEEVQKLNRIRQLNGKVSDAKKQIEGVYSEIGKKFYELHKDYIPEGFEELINTINEKTAEIEQLKEQLRQVKGVVLCPGCSMEVSGDERFCPNCGFKLPEVVEVADEGDEASVVVDAEDITGEAKDLAEDAKDAAADVAEDMAAAAGDAVENVKDMASDAAGNFKDTVSDLAGAAMEKTSEVAEGAKTVAENAAGELKEAAEDLKEKAEDIF